MPPGGRARRSVLSEVSTVRRPLWRASPASAAGISEDKRLFSEAQVLQPARPLVMSQQSKSHSRRGRRSTTGPFPPRAPLPAHWQYPCKRIPRALRAKYDHQPGNRVAYLQQNRSAGQKSAGPRPPMSLREKISVRRKANSAGTASAFLAVPELHQTGSQLGLDQTCEGLPHAGDGSGSRRAATSCNTWSIASATMSF